MQCGMGSGKDRHFIGTQRLSKLEISFFFLVKFNKEKNAFYLFPLENTRLKNFAKIMSCPFFLFLLITSQLQQPSISTCT